MAKIITMTPYQCRVLKLHLERRNEGYTIGDLRKIHNFLLSLEIACKKYEQEIEDVIKDHPVKTDAQGRQFVNKDLNDAIESINDRYENPVDFKVEDAEFELVHKVWKDSNSWSADSGNRESVLAIDDALKYTANGRPNDNKEEEDKVEE